MSTLLGPKTGYVDLLEKYQAEKNEKASTNPRTFNPLRPSSSGKCAFELAKEYAQFKGLTPTNQEVINPALSRIFSLGHSIEWNLIKQFEEPRKFNVRYKQQVVRFFQLSNGQWVEGSIDLSMFVEGATGGCLDVKSKKDRLSGFAATGWDEFNEGFSKMQSVEKVTDTLFWINDLDAFLSELKDPWLAPNFYQLNMYCNSAFIKDSGIDHGSVLQYNKNDSRLRELRFRPSDSVFKKTQAKFNAVHDAVTLQSELPKLKRNLEFLDLKCPPVSLCRHCWEAESLRAYYDTLPYKEWPKDTGFLGAVGKGLEEAYASYKEAQELSEQLTEHEQTLINAIEAARLTKVKFKDGAVYQIKLLKTPKPHLVLRRSK